MPYDIGKDTISKLISIRLDKIDLFKLKNLSFTLETSYQRLIKNWIKEKLNELI